MFKSEHVNVNILHMGMGGGGAVLKINHNYFIESEISKKFLHNGFNSEHFNVKI